MRVRLTALAILSCALGAPPGSAAPEFRAVLPAWVEAGKTGVIQVYGQDLSNGVVRFTSAGFKAKVISFAPTSPQTDDDKKLGNFVSAVQVTVAPGVRPGHYSFTFSGGVPGWLTVIEPGPEIKSVEPNDSLDAPQILPSRSETVVGKLDRDGVDVFRLDARAGQTWRFELFARRLGPAATLEPVLRLRDPRRAPVRAAVDEGNDCFIEYTMARDGPYLLELFDGDNRSDSNFAYRLAVERIN